MAGTKSSRESAEAAGWSKDAYPRPVGEKPRPPWRAWLKERENPKWDSFSWLTVRALFESVNDVLARLRPEIVNERRARWVASQRGRTAAMGDDLVIGGPPPNPAEQPGGVERAFLLVGDTGEQDASQYAVAPYLTAAALASDPYGRSHRPEFLQIVSDVIYPAGDINEYVNGFYIPYRDFKKPIYALPGNHDWYDGLDGFMYHFCGAEPLPPEHFRATEVRPATRLASLLWRRGTAPERERLNRWRDSRGWERDATKAVQPAPYFALDLGDLMLVCIDTGVSGAIDDEQGRWLLRVSALRKQKILLTGKPIYVDGAYHPGEISWKTNKREASGPEPHKFQTVDDVVRHEKFGYVAAIGGDVHNYQRYPIRLQEQGRTIYYLVSGGGGAYLSPTHRIGPLAETPKTEHRWPDGLKMPRDEDVPADDAEADPEEDDVASTFHCYPQRGDSLAYAARRAGPRMLNLVQTMAAAFIAAAAILLFAEPLDEAGALAVGTAYVPLAIAALLAIFAKQLGLKSLFGNDFGADPPAPWRPARVRYRFASGAFVVLLAFASIAFAADCIDHGLLLSNAQFWGMVAVALAIPALVIGAIIWTHDLRGSTPASLPQLAVVSAFAAAIPILHPAGELLGTPAWFTTLLFVFAFMAIGMLALGVLRGHARVDGDDAGFGRVACSLLDSLLTVAGPALLTYALAHNTDPNGVPWLAAALAWCGGWPLFVASLAKTREPSRLKGAKLHLARIKGIAGFLSVVAWITSAAILLHMIGDGWVATAGIGAVAVLAIILALGAMVMLVLEAMKRFILAIGLAAAVLAPFLLSPQSSTSTLIFIAASATLLAVAYLNVKALRWAQLDADAAQTQIRSILNEQAGDEVPAGPRHREPKLGRDTPLSERDMPLFNLLYPYRWAKRSRGQGAEKAGGLSQAVAKLLAELGDSDEPPFFKNLLRVDVGARQPDKGEEEETALDRELTIRCFGVTGFAREEAAPPVEDFISIPFRSAEAFGELFPQSAEPSQ